MAKYLTQIDIELVINLIDGWQSKLTWQGVVDKYAELTGRSITRQALIQNNEVVAAFKKRKCLAVRTQKTKNLMGGNFG